MKCVFSCVLLCLVVLGWLCRLTECRRAVSPDGRFYAVVSCRIWRTLVPRMPGGGDQPGYVTILTRQGQSCGTAPLPLAWMVADIKWSSTRAELRLVADWDLLTHTVRCRQELRPVTLEGG